MTVPFTIDIASIALPAPNAAAAKQIMQDFHGALAASHADDLGSGIIWHQPIGLLDIMLDADHDGNVTGMAIARAVRARLIGTAQ